MAAGRLFHRTSHSLGYGGARQLASPAATTRNETAQIMWRRLITLRGSPQAKALNVDEGGTAP